MKEKIITFDPSDSPAETNAKLKDVKDLDKITKMSMELAPLHRTSEKTAKQLVEEKGSSTLPAILYLESIRFNSGTVKFIERDCGTFGGGTVTTEFRTKEEQKIEDDREENLENLIKCVAAVLRYHYKECYESDEEGQFYLSDLHNAVNKLDPS